MIFMKHDLSNHHQMESMRIMHLYALKIEGIIYDLQIIEQIYKYNPFELLYILVIHICIDLSKNGPRL